LKNEQSQAGFFAQQPATISAATFLKKRKKGHAALLPLLLAKMPTSISSWPPSAFPRTAGGEKPKRKHCNLSSYL